VGSWSPLGVSAHAEDLLGSAGDGVSDEILRVDAHLSSCHVPARGNGSVAVSDPGRKRGRPVWIGTPASEESVGTDRGRVEFSRLGAAMFEQCLGAIDDA